MLEARRVTKTVIVTGGSRGIGAATALLLSRQGWAVCLNYRSSAAQAEALVRDIMEAGGQAIAHAGDVADEGSVVAMFDAAERAFGPLAGLVNNAGVLGTASTLADITLDRFQATMATNLTGVFLCAREAVRRMALSRGGQAGRSSTYLRWRRCWVRRVNSPTMRLQKGRSIP